MKNVLEHITFGRPNTVCAAFMILGLLVYGHEAYSQSTKPDGRLQFEPASIDVAAGSECVLHPEGNSDPAQSISVRADEDGVARFLAVRATPLDSIEALALDCIDSGGRSSTYPIDLQSEETFAPRPFDPSQTNLTLRPGLSGDPLSYTQQELIQGGYGVRPDPEANPGLYQKWLAAATAPAYQLRSVNRPASASLGSRSRVIPQPSILSAGRESSGPESTASESAASASAGRDSTDPESAEPSDPGVFTTPSAGWTGPVLFGSFSKGSSAAQTISYVLNSASWNVPSLTPGGYDTGNTSMTVWNGLGNVFQAILDVQTSPTAGAYGIHRQDFDPHTAGTDEGGARFTPNAGDTIFAEEWYCDSKGNVNLSGGYACTYMSDSNQHVFWACDSATTTSSDCVSYKLESADLANGNLGFQAEFIIEDDTDEVVKNSAEWPDFSPVTMLGAACVVKGSSADCEKWVSTESGTVGSVHPTTDPTINLLTDDNISNPMVRGDGHLNITLQPGGVTWDETATNIYEWNGSNFNTFSVDCASSIGVGMNSRGLTNGTPWSTGCHPAADGNYNIYQMQTGGKWVDMQNDIATQIAVSPLPNNIAWAINKAGQILYWNGSKFVENAAGGCATSIGVGPDSRGLTNGTPWITGCSANSAGNRGIYQMQTGGKWVLMQSDIAVRVAVGPQGQAWAINAAGEILYWNGSKFVENAAGGCATSIGVGPDSRGLTYGTPWITGCSPDSHGNRAVYQMQTGGKWVQMQSGVGWDIAVGPAGNAWALSTLR